MKKYLSIKSHKFGDNKETIHHIVAMPDDLEISCRLCSDGPMMSLDSNDWKSTHFISVDVVENLHKLCYDLEETDHAHFLESRLITLFNDVLSEFLISEEVILDTSIIKRMMEEYTCAYLAKIKNEMKPNGEGGKRKHKHNNTKTTVHR